MVSVFSVPAFFVVLREVLEACLVVGIVLAYLNKTGATHLRKWVWWGASAGIALSLVLGISFAVVFYVRGDKLFSGKSEKIFEGIIFLIAAALLTWMILWMLSMGHKMQHQIEEQVEKLVDRDDGSGKYGILFMVFIQVLREGIETWIFLFGAANAEDSWRAIPIPGILAIIVGLAASYALFRGMVELDIQAFFLASSIILMFFSAGLTSHAFHELQEADWFGKWKVDQRDWWNATMWSTEACCNDKKNQFFAFLRALFGYQDKPTFVEWGTYFAYWIIIIAIMLVFNWSNIRSARDRVASLTKKFVAWSLTCTFVAFIYVLANVTWTGTLTMTLAFIISTLATLTVYDVFASRIQVIASIRKPITLFSGVALAALTVFMAVLHIVQMSCEELSCKMPQFYYIGLIFSQNWASRGRAPNSWVSLGVLSWSLVVSVFFFGTMALLLVLFSFNVDSSGQYEYCNTEEVPKEISEEDTPVDPLEV